MTDATDGAAPRFKYRKLLFKKRWLTAGAVIVLVAGAWIAREPIADEFIRGELSGRDVPALGDHEGRPRRRGGARRLGVRRRG